MTTSETGKYVYWVAGETIDVKLTEMYNVRKYRKVEDYVIGEATWKHFKTGESPQTCSNDRKCPHCKAGLKPVIRFNTSIILMEDGEEYFSELSISLARLLGEKQVAFEEAGLDEEAILDKVFRIKKFDKVVAPYWEIKVVSDKAEKPSKVKKKVDLDEVDDEDDEDDTPVKKAEPAKKAKVDALDGDETDQVDDLIAKLEVKLNKNPDYDWKDIAEKSVKKLFKEDWKIKEAMSLIDMTLNPSDE